MNPMSYQEVAHFYVGEGTPTLPYSQPTVYKFSNFCIAGTFLVRLFHYH